MRKMHAQIFVQGSSKSKAFFFPRALLGAFRCARFVVRLGLVCLLIQALATFGYRHFLNKAMIQKENLRNQLAQICSESDSLNALMETYFEQEDLLYAKAGLQPLDHSIREFGIGGKLAPGEEFKRSFSSTAALLAQTEESLERLTGKIDLNRSAFRAVKGTLRQEQESWRFIPSIAPAGGRYASSFGRRTHPVTGERGKMHYGMDISGDLWTPIYAAADGVVQFAQPSASFGNFVAIDHGNGFVTKYGHMTRFIVLPGQTVKRYQIIGYMGNTGRSTGPHLHYEVWVNGEAVNPLAYILPNDHAIE